MTPPPPIVAHLSIECSVDVDMGAGPLEDVVLIDAARYKELLEREVIPAESLEETSGAGPVHPICNVSDPSQFEGDLVCNFAPLHEGRHSWEVAASIPAESSGAGR